MTTSTTTLFDPIDIRPFAAARTVTRTRHDDLAAVPAAINSEWIKLRSLRSNRAIFGSAVVSGLGMSWILATFVKTSPYGHKAFTVATTFMVSTWLTTVLAVIAGILMFTSEVQHATIAHAITAQPARWVTVAAKATVAAGFGLAMGVVGLSAGFAGAVASGLKMGGTSTMGATAAWGLLLTSFAAVLGVGVGMIIRHSSAAVSTALVWTFVLENLIRSMAPATLSRFLPFSAANGLLSIRSAGDTAQTLAAALTRTHDAFLFAGYSAAAVIAGTVMLYRRDAH
jgi:ABC-2 type transport system permease protein